MRLVILVVLTSLNLLATARTWTGTSGDGKWSTATNWSPNGALGGTDVLTFDNTCVGGNCVSNIDSATTTIGGITLAATYGSTVTVLSTVTLTLNNDISVVGGTFVDLATTHTMVVKGNLSFTGGTLTLTGCTLSFTLTSPSTLTFSGNFNTATGVTSVVINKPVTGNFTMSSGLTLTATITEVNGTLTIPATSTLTAVTTANITGSITIAGTFVGIASTTVQGSLNLTGTLTITGGTLNLTGITNGTATLTCTGNFNSITGVSSVVINKTAGANFTLSSGCTLSATITAISGVLTINSTGVLTNIGASSIISGLLVNGTFNTGTVTAYTTDIGGTWDARTGTINLSGATLAFSSTAGSSTTALCTGNFKTVTGLTAVTVNTTLAFTLGAGCTLDATLTQVNSTLTITSTGVFNSTNATGAIASLSNAGTFKSVSGTLTLGINWTNTGTFQHNSGTVTLSNAAHTFTGDTTFYNLTNAAPTANRTITFAAGSTQTVAHTLALVGVDGTKMLVLVSSSSPTRWLLAPTAGLATADWVDVKDSSSSSPVCATNSTNSGNNVNWFFQAPPCGSTPKHRVTMR